MEKQNIAMEIRAEKLKFHSSSLINLGVFLNYNISLICLKFHLRCEVFLENVT